MKLVHRLGAAANAFAKGDLEFAERECRALLQSGSRDAQTLHLLGLIRRRAGDLREAEALLRASVAEQPANAECRTNFGNLLRAIGRLAEAEAEYRAALDLAPMARDARVALARLLNQRGDFAAAEAETRRLLTQNPQDAEGWLTLGAAQRGMGRLTEAEASYRQALALRRDYGIAHHNLGALLGQLKRAEESLAELDRAAALGVAGRELHFNRGRALLELGRYDEAEAALTSAVRAAPKDTDSHVLLAKLRYMRGDPDFIREVASAAAEHRDPALAMLLGDLLRRAGRLSESEEVLRDLLRTRAWEPALGSALAVVLQEQGRLQEALQEARAAAAAAPDSADMAGTLITLLLQVGDPAAAQDPISEWRRRMPLDQSWLAHEATAARLLGEPRYGELYDYERFVRPYDLEPPAGYESIGAFNEVLAERLRALHSQGFTTHPLDQSLRLGTQTSRSLLADADPRIQAFLQALEAPLAAYRSAIGVDAEHPLLVRNRGETRLVGCWSVRLKRGGYHVNHVHPEGWISSAYYVEVPPDVDDE
ncbi:MAG TPA: tetratricopeptide repeat protein, partial [Steroidobacteraceae bacterium]|nr:tetratricopeptide repeat protein [Steroidobacteraceae bacterium]